MNAGDPCVPNAADKGNNIRWQLAAASTPIVDDGIDPRYYLGTIDYTVIYNKDTETIRFASDDMHVLADVDVQIYTVGGRLLYTFKADAEQSVANLPSGTYIVRWALGDASRSIKFKR